MTLKYEDDYKDAIGFIEEQMPGWSWTIGTITNKEHSMQPHGPGVCVTITGKIKKDHVVVYEKHPTSFYQAAYKAVCRIEKRQKYG